MEKIKTKFSKLSIFFGLIILTFGAYSISFAQVYANPYQTSSQRYPELCSVLGRTLSLGDTGDDVRRLQVVLGQEGIAYIGATGYYGPVTQSAVRVFQTRNGITPTGNVGPITLSRMRSLWCGGQTTGVSNNQYNNIQQNYNAQSLGSLEVSISPISSTNGNVTIDWNSNNAFSCNINNEQVELNGQRTYQIYSQTNFTITCYGNNGQQVQKTISVRPNDSVANLPNINLSINPSAALVNTYATIFWNSVNTYSCTLNGQTVPVSGSQQILVTSTRTAYQLSCVGNSGLTFSSTVYSNPNSSLNTNSSSASISASTNNVNYGFPVTLNWSSTNTSNCSVLGGPSTFTGTNGSQTIYPTYTTTYTISCTPTTSGSSVTNQVTIYVNNSNSGDNYLSANPSSGQSPLNVNFTGRVSSYGYTVDFGDGSQNYLSGCAHGTCSVGGSSTININHVYSNSGTYYVKLKRHSSNNESNCAGIDCNVVSTTVVTVNGNNNTGNMSANLYASSQNVNVGASATLTWNSSNTSYCNLLSNSSTFASNQTPNGSILVYPATNTLYQLNCYNSVGQTVSSQINITVTGNSNIPVLSVSPTTVSITAGSSTTLTLTKVNISSCTVTGGQYNNHAFNFSNLSVNPTTTTTYTFRCIGTDGVTRTASSTVTVGTSTGVSFDIRLSNTTPSVGDSVTFTVINKVNVNYCTINGGAITYGFRMVNDTYTVKIPGTNTYRVTCYGSNSTSLSKEITIVVGNSNVSSFSVSPTTVSITAGSSTTLTLTKVNISSCTVTGGQYNNHAFNFSNLSVNPTTTTTYTFRCIGTDGVTRTASSTVTVGTNSTVSSNDLSLTANKTSVTIGQPVVLTWVLRTGDLSSCKLTGGSLSQPISAVTGIVTVNPLENTTYTITCYKKYATNVTVSVYVAVSSTPTSGSNTGTVSITASPSIIGIGQSTTLSWSSGGASVCTIVGGLTNSTIGGTSGTLTVSPKQTTLYNIICYTKLAPEKVGSVLVTVTGNTNSVDTKIPRVSVTPNTGTVTSGQTLRLTIFTENVTSCTANSSPISTSGYWVINPTSDTTYNIRCMGTNGQIVTDTVVITVYQMQG